MFFGMVTPAFNTKNPYAQEDYMNVLVNSDWDDDPSNIWLDIVASTDIRAPIVSGMTKRLYFILLEVEEDDTIVDSAMVEFTFVYGSNLDNVEFISPTGGYVYFESTPTIGQTVKALLVSLKNESFVP